MKNIIGWALVLSPVALYCLFVLYLLALKYGIGLVVILVISFCISLLFVVFGFHLVKM